MIYALAMIWIVILGLSYFICVLLDRGNMGEILSKVVLFLFGTFAIYYATFFISNFSFLPTISSTLNWIIFIVLMLYFIFFYALDDEYDFLLYVVLALACAIIFLFNGDNFSLPTSLVLLKIFRALLFSAGLFAFIVPLTFVTSEYYVQAKDILIPILISLLMPASVLIGYYEQGEKQSYKFQSKIEQGIFEHKLADEFSNRYTWTDAHLTLEQIDSFNNFYKNSDTEKALQIDSLFSVLDQFDTSLKLYLFSEYLTNSGNKQKEIAAEYWYKHEVKTRLDTTIFYDEELRKFLVQLENLDQKEYTKFYQDIFAEAKKSFTDVSYTESVESRNLLYNAKKSEKKRRRRKAISYYISYLQLNPNDLQTRLKLAKLEKLEGNSFLSALNYSLLAESKHEDPQIWFELGRSQLSLGNSQKAFEYFSEAKKHITYYSTPRETINSNDQLFRILFTFYYSHQLEDYVVPTIIGSGKSDWLKNLITVIQSFYGDDPSLYKRVLGKYLKLIRYSGYDAKTILALLPIAKKELNTNPQITPATESIRVLMTKENFDFSNIEGQILSVFFPIAEKELITNSKLTPATNLVTTLLFKANFDFSNIEADRLVAFLGSTLMREKYSQTSFAKLILLKDDNSLPRLIEAMEKFSYKNEDPQQLNQILASVLIS